MLRQLYRQIVDHLWRKDQRRQQIIDLQAKGQAIISTGSFREGIPVFRSLIQLDPHNAAYINDLAVCLSEIGQLGEARALFDIAWKLDERRTLTLINRAKTFIDDHDSKHALPLLRQAKLVAPELAHTDGVYANLLHSRGLPNQLVQFQKRDWLGHFDHLRIANTYLFYSTYTNTDENWVAKEHSFWAETLPPVQESAGISKPRDGDELPLIAGEAVTRRIRIGYWSPDIRNHSVRYFLRPLLAGHNKAKVEVFVYHDHHGTDEQTHAIAGLADHFDNLFDLSDAEVVQRIRRDQLDILFELSGHTSANRLPLMQYRMAKLHVTALGYPPTTGLKTIDYKLMDRHTVGPNPEKYYTETPLILPTSFWCFDPYEEAPIADLPPCASNGFITFGYFGNVIKISDEICQCWKLLLNAIPSSKLIVRSISFLDDASVEAFSSRLRDLGLELDRLECQKPLGGRDYFAAYNEIDIILDTFPFNGGTTTAFALYMGVPVVTMYGQSLTSRMSLSMLTTLGESEWASVDHEAYTRVAIKLANDQDLLRKFKQEARGRFKQTALGNGEIYAYDLEVACLGALRATKRPTTDIGALPPNELMRRAVATGKYDNPAGSQRIAQYAVGVYPNLASARLLLITASLNEQTAGDVIEELMALAEQSDEQDRCAIYLNCVRIALLYGYAAKAQHALQEARQSLDPKDTYAVAFHALLAAAYINQHSVGQTATVRSTEPDTLTIPGNPIRVALLHIVDGSSLSDSDLKLIRRPHLGGGIDFAVHLTTAESRYEQLDLLRQGLSADIVVVIHGNITVSDEHYLARTLEALAGVDMVSFAGSKSWQRLDWQNGAPDSIRGSWLSPSAERQGWWEANLLGNLASPCRFVDDVAVLAGEFVAFRTCATRSVNLRGSWVGAPGLLEQGLSFDAARSGARLRVAHDIGIVFNPAGKTDDRYALEARLAAAEDLGIDPFSALEQQSSLCQAPAPSLSEAQLALERYSYSNHDSTV